MRILIRTSRWAIWARRLASFAVPLAVIPVVLHHQQVIATDAFHAMELVALAVALAALVASIVALVRLWITGDRGWDRAFGGLFLSLVCLAPFAYGLAEASRYPRLADVATEGGTGLAMVSPLPRQDLPPVSEGEVNDAFPNAHTRSYALDTARLYEVVSKLVNEWGWDVKLRRAPAVLGGDAQINAIATTWLGWRDEVAIRVSSDVDGAAVDMRSVSLTPSLSDLGANGRRIEDFLLALDNAVTILLRDSPLGAPATPAPATPTAPGGGDVVVPAERPADLRPPPPDAFDTEAPPPD